MERTRQTSSRAHTTSTRRTSITLNTVGADDEDDPNEPPLVEINTGAGAARDSHSYNNEKPKHNRTMNDEQCLAEVRQQLARKDVAMYELIGMGSFAEVYRGAFIKLKKTVAIKVVDLHKTSSHYRSVLLPQELSIMKQLKHSRLIKVYSLSQVANRVVMVMEFASKGSLSDLICRVGSLREGQSWALFGQIMSGLSYMHNRSIAHRDLKLDNVLLSRGGVPKLADFSFAVYFDGRNMCTNVCGSVPYFAPELLAHRPYNPMWSDVWSIGVCLYIVTNDIFPFVFRQDRDMLAAQRARNWRFRARIEQTFPASYKNLMKAMLEPTPSARIRTDDVVNHEWMTVMPPPDPLNPLG